MTARVLEIEGTWEEILAQSAKFRGHRVRITIFADEESQPSPEDSFRQAWQEIKQGKVHPISELWEGIDAE
jgi:hypothetical protein